MPITFAALASAYPTAERPDFYRARGGQWANLVNDPNYVVRRDRGLRPLDGFDGRRQGRARRDPRPLRRSTVESRLTAGRDGRWHVPYLGEVKCLSS
jgi:hypothetical protein